MNFKYYYQNDQEVLADLASSKARLLKTESASEIQQLLSEIKLVLRSLNDYSLEQAFVAKLLAEVLADPLLFSKKGIQKIFSELWSAFTAEQKKYLTQMILKHFHLYEHEAFCWAICNFIYQDLNDWNPVATKQVYETLIQQGTKPSSLSTALYFNCGVDIDFIGPIYPSPMKI